MQFYTHGDSNPRSLDGAIPQTPYAGQPRTHPDTTPDLDILERIFHDYQYNFRSFESWNLCQRIKCNKTHMQEHRARIFKAIKPARRDPIDRLVQKQRQPSLRSPLMEPRFLPTSHSRKQTTPPGGLTTHRPMSPSLPQTPTRSTLTSSL